MEQYDSNKGPIKFSKHTLIQKRFKETNDDIVKNISFQSIIGGMEAEKETCNHILAMVSHPEWCKNTGKINKPKGFLLQGFLGNGKTLSTRAFMQKARQATTHSDAGCYEFKSSDFIHKSHEEGIEIIRGIFNSIRAECYRNNKTGMGVIFIDEYDQVWKKIKLINQEDQKMKDILNTFKAEIISLRNHCPNNPNAFIFIIEATNHLEQIDDAIKSHLNYHIEVKPLNTNGRKKIL